MKFGGTSVGSASSIQQVRKIVKESLSIDKVIRVVSAMSGTTDQLIECGRLAAGGDESYEATWTLSRHLQTMHIIRFRAELVLSFTKTCCNEMEDVFNGIFLLGEQSNQTSTGSGYGELILPGS